MKKIFTIILLVFISQHFFAQSYLINKTLIWNTPSFGHKIYSSSSNDRSYLNISSRHNSSGYKDIITITSDRRVGINTETLFSQFNIISPKNSDNNGLIYGANLAPMFTLGDKKYSKNLFLLQTKVYSNILGLHSYAYKNNTRDWSEGTIRLSSCIDATTYKQNNWWNNLNWIDFIGNAGGIDFGIGTNEPVVSIRKDPNNLNIRGEISITNESGNVSNNGCLIYGQNKASMTTFGDKDYSKKLLLVHTKINGSYLGLHAYAYKKSNSTVDWSDGTIRLSSQVDNYYYEPNNKWNNLNWIDFIGNAGGIDFGIGKNDPCVSIRKDPNILSVRGTIKAEEIIVTKPGTADFVFEKNYKLRKLSEVELFINKNKHLPDVPSAKQMKAEGTSLTEMNKLLLQKIEELTLYTIKQEKALKEQSNILKEQRCALNNKDAQINNLKKDIKIMNENIQKLSEAINKLTK